MQKNRPKWRCGCRSRLDLHRLVKFSVSSRFFGSGIRIFVICLPSPCSILSFLAWFSIDSSSTSTKLTAAADAVDDMFEVPAEDTDNEDRGEDGERSQKLLHETRPPTPRRLHRFLRFFHGWRVHRRGGIKFKERLSQEASQSSMAATFMCGCVLQTDAPLSSMCHVS